MEALWRLVGVSVCPYELGRTDEVGFRGAVIPF